MQRLQFVAEVVAKVNSICVCIDGWKLLSRIGTMNLEVISELKFMAKYTKIVFCLNSRTMCSSISSISHMGVTLTLELSTNSLNFSIDFIGAPKFTFNIYFTK